MDDYFIKGNILIVSTLIPAVIGYMRYSILDKASRVFFYLTVLSMVAEALAYYAAVFFKNNMLVYNVANIAELFVVCVYFNYTIASLSKRNLGLALGYVSIAIGIVNNFFIQSVNGITSYFLFYQALVTIVLSITSLSSFLRPEDTRNAVREIHFWFPVILIFCWSLKYLLYTLIEFYGERLKVVAPVVIPTLLMISIFTNIAIAVNFYLYPKLHPHVR